MKKKALNLFLILILVIKTAFLNPKDIDDIGKTW